MNEKLQIASYLIEKCVKHFLDWKKSNGTHSSIFHYIVGFYYEYVCG